MANKFVYALTPSSLISFGIFEETYEFYLSMQDFCADLVEKHKLPTVSGYFYEIKDINNGGRAYLSLTDANQIREKCRKEFRKRLISFCNENFMYFADPNPTKYIKDMNLYRFWFITQKNKTIEITGEDGKKHYFFGFHGGYISFQSFLTDIEYFIACAVMSERREAGKVLTIENVLEGINQRINTIVEVKRESAIKECDTALTEPATIYVFKALHNITCIRQNHDVVPSVRNIPLLAETKQIEIPAHLCKTCGKVFIGERMLEEYVKEYGWLFVRRFSDDTTPEYSSFALESKLHSLGYNVVDGGYTEKERHTLLKLLLERKAITYLEACRDIENAIDMFYDRRNFQLAVKKWRTDLKYIGDLQLKNKSSI